MTITIYNLQQRTVEWQKLRSRIYITSSIVNEILRPRDSKVYERLVYDKAYQCRRSFQSIATDHGIKYEPLAMRDFKEQYHLPVEEVGFVINADYPYMGVSPDGLIGSNEILELKCPYSRKIKHGEIPPSYYHQVQLQLMITGRVRAYYYEVKIENDRVIDRNLVIVNRSIKWYYNNIDKLKQFIIDVEAQKQHCIIDTLDVNGFRQIHYQNLEEQHPQHLESSSCHSEQSVLTETSSCCQTIGHSSSDAEDHEYLPIVVE